ncbi:MAG: GTP cyclohydrolase [Pyrinomonadaceae bacterium]
MVIRLAERDLKTKYGVFSEILYYDGIAESIALVMGDVKGREDVLCRIHSACIGGHVFNSVECECAGEMAAAQAAIQQVGKGVVVYLDQEGKGNGHLALINSIPFKKAGHSQSEAYKMAGFEADERSFRPAAEILADLRVSSVILLTGNPEKADDLHKASIKVSGTQALSDG